MTNEQAAALQYPFTANEIEWRVLHTTKDKSKGQVAAYVDSRAIQDRLDAVLGRENWQNRFCTVQGKDNASTTQVCELSIYYPNRGEWITKSNGAGNTDIEPVKGGLSNAFKRAASMWGVGRYLYDLKNLWVPLKDGKYIPDDQLPILIKQYNQFVRQLLSAGNPAAGKQQAAPAVQPKTAPAPKRRRRSRQNRHRAGFPSKRRPRRRIPGLSPSSRFPEAAAERRH